MASRTIPRMFQQNPGQLICHTARMSSTKPHQGQKIGIIGLGTVGSKITANLLKAGFVVSALHDSDPKAGKHLPKDIQRTNSPRELAECCDVVMTALPAPLHVKAALSGERGVLAGLQEGGIWIDHSTTDYQQAIELANQAGYPGENSYQDPMQDPTGY